LKLHTFLLAVALITSLVREELRDVLSQSDHAAFNWAIGDLLHLLSPKDTFSSMPGKGRGGKKAKGRRGRAEGGDGGNQRATEVTLMEDGQQYGQVLKLLGGCHVQVLCFDGKTRLCTIRGKMKRRVWITVGDIVLLGLRPFQDTHADVIQRYTTEEARRLKMMGELPDTADLSLSGTTAAGSDDVSADIEFDFTAL
jgi:translation initiation factor 1A